MRILFITSNNVGDAVLNNGLLAHLIAQSDNPEVTVVAGRASSSLYKAVPGLRKLIVLKKERCHAHWFRLWKQVGWQRWDVVVDMRRTVIGHVLWTRKHLVAPYKDRSRHRVAELADLMPGGKMPDPVAWFSKEDESKSAQWIAEGETVLALGPAANWHGKQWPSERFVALARALTEEAGPLAGARIAVFAAAGEREQIENVLEAFPEEQLIDLVGKTDLGEAAACLKRCAYYIGNDSGLMHLAAACDIPTLGLFGPSSEVRYHPWGEKAQWVRTPESFDEIVSAPDYDRHKPVSYMVNLTLEKVLEAARSMISRHSKS
ncbi:glycosyltransferase family 9 protein [Kiloniella sp. b19]|uniref:glycosyltransferase family 9 protein n=1 Tax=Kiloniella sp. GXU_MW_B19 TaxID=3141326 RepID=UPI0031D57E4B